MSQVETGIKNYKDLMVLIDIPCVIYTGEARSGSYRFGKGQTASSHDYGVFHKNIPEMVYNLKDLAFFSHPDRKKNFEIVLRRMEFPQYKYVELQNANGYYSRAINFCISIGARHMNPSDDLQELTEEERLNIAKVLAKKQADEKKKNEIFKAPKREFDDLTVIELKILAKSVTITGYSKMKKGDLVHNLKEYHKSDFIPT